MNKYYLKDIEQFLEKDAVIRGVKNTFFTNIQTSDKINKDSLDWVNPLKKDKVNYIIESKAGIILCEKSLEEQLPESVFDTKCLVFVDNPKLSFIRIMDRLFGNNITWGIHPSAVIHPEAEIDNMSYIGPHSYIGKCKIGKGSKIYGNCHIYDNTTIGDNVTIHAGTVIGAEGFGYQRNEKGEFEIFPHIGGVIIKNNVDIGSNTSIDRGALGNTIIEEGAKIDNLVHIAHNVTIGKHSAVIAHAMIGGSTVIGDYTWIAPSASVRDQLAIGNKVTIGMGAVVTKNIPDGETWTGSPARPLVEFLEQQKKLKKL